MTYTFGLICDRCGNIWEEDRECVDPHSQLFTCDDCGVAAEVTEVISH